MQTAYAAPNEGLATPLPDFDLHSVEEALKVNHRIYGGTPLSPDDLRSGIRQYREFLRRHKAEGMPDRFEVPSYLVDRVWHTHMCETRQYAEDCVAYFGRVFHHSSGRCNGGSPPA